KRRPENHGHPYRHEKCAGHQPSRSIARPCANRTLHPGKRQYAKHRTDQLMHQLLQSQPESGKSAPPARPCLNHVGRSHIRQSYLTGCPSPAPSRAVATILLSKGPVNHLETTSSDGLVSNYSESYNRSAVGEKPALQLDDHLKNLLRELGHAINDTVSESDRITGAIAGVRAHGYDIVLKLDATIGLARPPLCLRPPAFCPQPAGPPAHHARPPLPRITPYPSRSGLLQRS